MDTLELFSPQIQASIGPYQFTQGIEFEVYSSRDSLFDWAKVRFTGVYSEVVELERRDAADLHLGYEGALEPVFTGYVSQGYSSGNADEIVLKDAMLLLESTKVNNTFLETTPQEMIQYGLSQAGISQYQLASQAYPERRRVPIRDMSVRAMLEEIHTIWGIRPAFFFSNGVFHWGTEPEQMSIYFFEYGVNILTMTRSGGNWEMETIAVPFIRHSHTIEVDHPKVAGTFLVRKMVVTSTSEGFIRTVITF